MNRLAAGMRIERLTLLQRIDHRRWIVRCDCGTEKAIDVAKLVRSTGYRTRSCGCYRRQRAASLNRTHGRTRTPAYRSWTSMRNRCEDPTCNGYERYGGRGICVCDRWRDSFVAFLADMGERPDGTTLDRLDSDGNYEPGNCRWATHIEQEANKRNRNLVSALGESLTAAEWSRRTGVNANTIRGRLARGWTPDRAVTVAGGVYHHRAEDPR